MSAAKSAKVTTKHVDGDTTKTLAKWRSQGMSLTAIWKRAKKEGLKTEAGDGLSYYKIKELLENAAVAVAVGETITDPRQVLSDFIETHVVTDETPKARIYSNELTAAYVAFCERRAIAPLPNSQLGIMLAEKFPGCKFKTMGKTAYRGLGLKVA